MKKVFAALAILSIVSVTAYGKVGVGYMNFDGAVSCKYWMEQYGFQGTLRGDYIAAKANQAESYMVADISAYFLYPIIKKDNIWLNGVLGGSYVINSNIDMINKDRNDISFTVALSPELYVRDNLSLECMFGIRAAMYGDTKINDQAPTVSDKYNRFVTFGYPISLSGGIGFHFYFPETVKSASESTKEVPSTEIEEDIEE